MKYKSSFGIYVYRLRRIFSLFDLLSLSCVFFLISMRYSPIIIYSLADNQHRHMHNSCYVSFWTLVSISLWLSSFFPILVFNLFFPARSSLRTIQILSLNKRIYVARIQCVFFPCVLLWFIWHCWYNKIKVLI